MVRHVQGRGIEMADRRELLASLSSGRGITWVTSGAKIGVALEAASAAGQMIEVLLIPNVA